MNLKNDGTQNSFDGVPENAKYTSKFTAILNKSMLAWNFVDSIIA